MVELAYHDSTFLEVSLSVAQAFWDFSVLLLNARLAVKIVKLNGENNNVCKLVLHEKFLYELRIRKEIR